VSVSISLIAGFIPFVLMGGIIGRLFREFAMTISIAILISLAVSLATTPMMCAVLLKSEAGRQHGRTYRISERFFEGMLNLYRRSLTAALRHPATMMMVLAVVFGLNFYLYNVIPKGFFPQQDTGRMVGNIQADQASFQLMQRSGSSSTSSRGSAVSRRRFHRGGRSIWLHIRVVASLSDGRRDIGRLRRQMACAWRDAVPAGSWWTSRRRPRHSRNNTPCRGDAGRLTNGRRRSPPAAGPAVIDVNSDQQNKGLNLIW
jgi:multidrug efflux pump